MPGYALPRHELRPCSHMHDAFVQTFCVHIQSSKESWSDSSQVAQSHINGNDVLEDVSMLLTRMLARTTTNDTDNAAAGRTHLSHLIKNVHQVLPIFWRCDVLL